MTERERLALKAFREAEQERERLEREKRERPIKDATDRINQTTREIYNTVRQRLLTMRDDEFKIDPATTKPIPTKDVPQWQREQSAKFKASNPDYYPCPGNEAAMVDYINRNAPDIKLVSALQLEWAFKRLREFRLLAERPAPAVEPEEPPTPSAADEPQHTASQQPQSELHEGIDLHTGLPRKFTAYEVDWMTAEQYRRIFGLYGDRAPRLRDMRI